MKIIKSQSLPGDKRGDGRVVYRILDLTFDKPVSDMVAYLVFLDGVSQTEFKGKHYHSDSIELILLPNGGEMELNGNAYQLDSWDMVVLEQGDRHAFKGGPGIIHLAFKLPALDDKVKD